MKPQKRSINYAVLFRLSIGFLLLYQFFLYGFVDRLWSHVWAERFYFLVVCTVLFLLFKRFAQRRGMTPAKNMIISGILPVVMAALLLTSDLMPLL